VKCFDIDVIVLLDVARANVTMDSVGEGAIAFDAVGAASISVK
jgi:hypothetical protein